MKFKVNLRSKLLYRPCTKALAIILRPNKLKLRRRFRSFITTIKLPALLHRRPTKLRMEDSKQRHTQVVGDSRTRRARLLFPVPVPSPSPSPSSAAPAPAPARALDSDGVEDACRSFENYLVEMILEEGKLKDLMDVEELLFCWKKLKCPVFSDLVSRFYGELCKDLFTTPTS